MSDQLAFGPEDHEAGQAPARSILTVRQLNERISRAVEDAFPATVWVRGEVQRLPTDAARRQHVYFELHETGVSGAADFQIPVSLMGWDRSRFGLGRYLDGTDPDFQLANKLEVCLECKVDFYAKFGKLSLKVVGVDKNFSLGRLEAIRREVLAYLEKEDLLRLNAAVPLPDLPLSVGLITSEGSAAEKDFRTGLESSGFGFRVTLAPARMQGERVKAEVIAALDRLVDTGVDVIVITRGGGSRADLSWFDQKDLAVAIARCPVPVITAIGHEIDRSIADQVAHLSCKTPTAAAEFLADRLIEAAGRVDEAAEILARLLADRLAAARRRLEAGFRIGQVAAALVVRSQLPCQRNASRLQQVLNTRLTRIRSQLSGYSGRVQNAGTRAVGDRRRTLESRGMRIAGTAESLLTKARMSSSEMHRRLPNEAIRTIARWRKVLKGLDTQTVLLDPARILRQGFTLTRDGSGRTIRSVTELVAGDALVTHFADGTAASRVESVRETKTKSGGDPPPETRKKRSEAHGGKKGGPGKDRPGQKSLF